MPLLRLKVDQSEAAIRQRMGLIGQGQPAELADRRPISAQTISIYDNKVILIDGVRSCRRMCTWVGLMQQKPPVNLMVGVCVTDVSVMPI
jgi:hypothetical protein